MLRGRGLGRLPLGEEADRPQEAEQALQREDEPIGDGRPPAGAVAALAEGPASLQEHADSDTDSDWTPFEVPAAPRQISRPLACLLQRHLVHLCNYYYAIIICNYYVAPAEIT